MKIEGGCYCGALRFSVEGDPLFKGQCHCRECQYISGGHPNAVMGMPDAGFQYTKGSPKTASRAAISRVPSRASSAGSAGRTSWRVRPRFAGAVMLKVGTFDDPSVYDAPQMVIYTIDKQSFHHVPEGIPVFERVPG